MKFLLHSLIIAALATVVASTPAAAQSSDERVAITFTPAAASAGGDTELALAVTAGYRFADHLSFEGDFTWIDGGAGGGRDRVFGVGEARLTTRGISDLVSRTIGRNGAFDSRGFPNVGNIPNIPFPVEGFTASTDGRTVIGTFGVRYEPTVQTARFRPYVSGGLGINHTEQELRVSIGTAARAVDESISHSGFAFSAGGGAAIRLFRSVWASADAKYFRLSRDRNVIRFGGGLGVRF
ncbi:MAG: outer membrane beta-barrel protein [Vicinamibacterales bacterium]